MPLVILRNAIHRFIDNHALIYNQPYAVEVLVESLEQLIIRPVFSQRVLVLPHSLPVRHIINTLDAKEISETCMVLDMVFYLGFAQAV